MTQAGQRAADEGRAGHPHPSAAAQPADSPLWEVVFARRTYGPYRLVDMLHFIADGRIDSTSMISRSGRDGIYPVSEDPVLSRLFYTVSFLAVVKHRNKAKPGYAAND